ncbi:MULTISPECIES: hypothetical protein [unclassified Streptomyces]|uniref:hypothetical protein n=1 Tax=unclassified Streptomyces TaxID=2593676 RepID=UPI0033DDCC66
MGLSMRSACEQCGEFFDWEQTNRDHWRSYCSGACKQSAYRQRRREEKEAFEREQERRARQEQRRRQEEQSSRKERRQESSGTNDGFFGRRSSPNSTEARATVFRMAGLVDDGSTTVRSAYRKAARKVHPDLGGDVAAFKLLERAVALLKTLGLFV